MGKIHNLPVTNRRHWRPRDGWPPAPATRDALRAMANAAAAIGNVSIADADARAAALDEASNMAALAEAAFRDAEGAPADAQAVSRFESGWRHVAEDLAEAADCVRARKMDDALGALYGAAGELDECGEWGCAYEASNMAFAVTLANNGEDKDDARHNAEAWAALGAGAVLAFSLVIAAADSLPVTTTPKEGTDHE